MRDQSSHKKEKTKASHARFQLRKKLDRIMMFGLKQSTNTKGTKAKTTDRKPRRTAIVETFACNACMAKYFYKVIKCPQCESTSIDALKDVVIIP